MRNRSKGSHVVRVARYRVAADGSVCVEDPGRSALYMRDLDLTGYDDVPLLCGDQQMVPGESTIRHVVLEVVFARWTGDTGTVVWTNPEYAARRRRLARLETGKTLFRGFADERADAMLADFGQAEARLWVEIAQAAENALRLAAASAVIDQWCAGRLASRPAAPDSFLADLSPARRFLEELTPTPVS